MSFANIDLEAQKSIKNGKITDGPQTDSQNELDKIINNTSEQLRKFGNLITQFDNQLKTIGTKRDSSKTRENLDSLTNNLNNLEDGIKLLVENLDNLINKNSDEKGKNKIEITNRQVIIKERLLNEYNDLHRAFNKSHKQYSDRKRAHPIKSTEKTPLLESSSGGYDSQQVQQQTQVQVQDQDIINETELQYHRMLTEERNREIEQAHEGIMEVNSIFKDLGELIHQQGEQLDLVENNVGQLQSNAQQAASELNKAHEYQKRKGKWSCILLVALCVFVLVVVLAVIS
ncbi:syntaxin Vam3p [[Candida] jaroonii]|uniref:Syntaxin Vam3p n=1 Tax=[Candida] jaroonii TaxID=467808 RepID=A0ACA9Y042_9ASCO|nr:syntaxin Vam3p [[Candida] jaroonii]